MEKVVAVLWRRQDDERHDLNEQILTTLVPTLQAAGATRVRANVHDETVAGTRLGQRWAEPAPDAVVQFWLPSANGVFRGEIDAAFATVTGGFALYVVAESVALAPPDDTATPSGIRSMGFSQVAMLPLPDRLSREEFLTIWHDGHTQVAIDTQATFEYVQNTIVRRLTEHGPAYVAIVEECFPLDALHDPQTFFDAGGDQQRFKDNIAAMMASCDRFIDRGQIDVLVTSQFDVPDVE